MGAVDVGVGHDDHTPIAQILIAIVRAGAAAERLDEIGKLLVLRKFVRAGAGDIEDFAAQRQHRLHVAVARLLGRAAGGIALDHEKFGALGRAVGAIGEFAGQPQFAHGSLARDVFLLAAANAFLGAFDNEVEELVGLRRVAGEPVIEWVFDRLLDDPLRLGRGQRSLVWPWNSGSRMKTESMAPAPVITSSLVMAAARLP